MNLVYIVAQVGTPCYLFLNRKKGRAWIVNTVIATLAFPLWTYALHSQYGWWKNSDQMTAGVLVMLFTFIVGLIKPVL